MDTPQTGHVYHIKDEYHKIACDSKLMRNYEGGSLRPTYYCIKDEQTNLLWMIPMSTRVEKYKAIIEKDTAKYGSCTKIVLAPAGGRQAAFLIQNTFPILEKYIDHPHTIQNHPLFLEPRIQALIQTNFRKALSMQKRGINVIYTDIFRLEALMLFEQGRDASIKLGVTLENKAKIKESLSNAQETADSMNSRADHITKKGPSR